MVRAKKEKLCGLSSREWYRVPFMAMVRAMEDILWGLSLRQWFVKYVCGEIILIKVSFVLKNSICASLTKIVAVL